MAQMKSGLKFLVVFLLVGGVVYFVIDNYAWVFSKKVNGEIVNVERVTETTAILSARTSEAQLHSYSILIRGEDGKLYTASSEDRQWQVAKKGYCVEALLYRYPPWRLSLANTFFNARVIQLSECKGQPITAPDQVPVVPPTDSPSAPTPSAPGSGTPSTTPSNP